MQQRDTFNSLVYRLRDLISLSRCIPPSLASCLLPTSRGFAVSSPRRHPIEIRQQYRALIMGRSDGCWMALVPKAWGGAVLEWKSRTIERSSSSISRSPQTFEFR